MKNLLISITTALALFATSALADHTLYIPGDTIYRDSGLVTCPTKEATLKVIQVMATTKYLTYGVTRRLAEPNNCEFHRDPVNFIISDLFCRTTTITGKTFTIAKTLIEGKTEERFTILFTDSKTLDCGEHSM